MSIRFRDNNDSEKQYAPGDTRIISYSSSLCDGLTLSGERSASLYLLDTKPPLSAPVNTLTASPPSVIDGDRYEYLNYYLHHNSKLSMSACLLTSGLTLRFYLIKGKDNFDSWKDDGNSVHSAVHRIISSCPPSSDITYTFDSGDMYYFVFDNLGKSSINLKATLIFNRTEYLPHNVSIADSCRITGDDQCSVSVPYGSHYIGLVEVDNSEGAEDNFDMNSSCNARAWIYAIMVVIPLLFVTAALFTTCVVCIYCYRRRSRNYSLIGSAPEATPDAPAANTVGTTTTVTTTMATAPPPINPNYNPPPPLYGSTHFTDSPADKPPDYNTALQQ